MTNTTKTTRQSAVKKTTREQQECLMAPLGEENTKCSDLVECAIPPQVREAEDKISKINLEVREKALKLVEKIIDSCTTAPLDTVHLNNVTKAIELYTAFK